MKGYKVYIVKIGKVSEIVNAPSVEGIGEMLRALGYKKGTRFHWKELERTPQK